MLFKATFVGLLTLTHAYASHMSFLHTACSHVACLHTASSQTPCLPDAKLISKISKQASLIKSHKAIIKTQAQTVLRLSKGRALVLAAQILYLRVGRQPKPVAHNSQYFRHTNISLLAAPRELDLLVDARNAVSHPCCPDALRAESVELLELLTPLKSSLSKQEQLALQILGLFLLH